MKVAQINTHAIGGAAVVAKRLHLALLESGVGSSLLTRYGSGQTLLNHTFLSEAGFQYSLRKKISNSFLLPAAKFLQNLKSAPQLIGRPAGLEIFSVLQSVGDHPTFAALESSDIIHLHWVSNFIDYGSFFRRFVDKKFVWTLHDMNPFTGGCHHADGCQKFESVCEQCPQLHPVWANYAKVVQDAKIEGLSSLSDDQLIVVSPSRWLAELSGRSAIMKRFKHVVVPNPSFKIPSDVSRQRSVREALGLSTTKKIILFASDNLTNARKGIQYLFEAVKALRRNDEVQLVGIGHAAGRQAGLDIIYPGTVSEVGLLSKYYSNADIFVTPSVAENSPLVVIEALTCGTPVVASRVGGIPDLVHEGNGILFSVKSASELTRSIEGALFEKKFDRTQISEEAQRRHNPLKVAQGYLDVYKSVAGDR
jgi:glycosyltransferase involved in cell wall biosynthesis